MSRGTRVREKRARSWKRIVAIAEEKHVGYGGTRKKKRRAHAAEHAGQTQGDQVMEFDRISTSNRCEFLLVSVHVVSRMCVVVGGGGGGGGVSASQRALLSLTATNYVTDYVASCCG